MPVRYERPVSHSAYSARRLSLFSLLFFTVALVLHRFGSFETPLFSRSRQSPPPSRSSRR